VLRSLGPGAHHEELSLDTGVIYEKVDRGSESESESSDGAGA